MGPPVDVSPSGPARFVATLQEAFDLERAMDTVAFGDGFYRAPASEGYEAVLEHLERELRSAGFGDAQGLRLESLTIDPRHRAWTPRSARVSLDTGAEQLVLHRFERQADRDRLMLPMGAPACDVRGRAVFRIRDVRPGTILVTASPPRADVLRRARVGGALAVLSSSLASYNVKPGTMEPLEDALRLRVYPADGELPCGQISRAAQAQIEAADQKFGQVQVRFEAKVSEATRPLRMLAATIVGSSLPLEAIVMPSHIGYAGASDNASGFAASLENAMLLAREMRAGALDRPKRSLVFLWGPEIVQSETWLQQTDLKALAAVTAVACGDAASADGSPQYLERGPDPGAMVSLPPDAHTQWGTGEVTVDDLLPNGVALVARCALADVAAASGGWSTADHPWEGGSDPDAFQEQGVPAVLLWHFSSSWYHTSLDRIERIDGQELRRSAVAALSAAMALAAPEAGDLERYLRSVDLEEGIRVRAALQAGNEDLAGHWEDWCAGTRAWLAALCR